MALVAKGGLWIADAQGENTKLLIRSLPDPEDVHVKQFFQMQDPHWSPDGTRIVYADGGIRIVNVSNGQKTDLIESRCYELDSSLGMPSCFYGEWFLEPAWSPDGKYILFRNQNADYSSLQILATDQAGSVPTSITLSSNYYEISDIAWSLDSASLVFEGYALLHKTPITDSVAYGLMQVSPNYSDVRVLWPEPQDKSDFRRVNYPKVMPSGRILFFYSDPANNTGQSLDLVEGLVGNGNFYESTIWRNVLPNKVTPFIWHSQGTAFVFGYYLAPYSNRYIIAVGNVVSSKIYILATDVLFPLHFAWGKP
ncbi:MAG: hypothetical protein ACOYYS_22105 [Chloroflexota bacterium]